MSDALAVCVVFINHFPERQKHPTPDLDGITANRNAEKSLTSSLRNSSNKTSHERHIRLATVAAGWVVVSAIPKHRRLLGEAVRSRRKEAGLSQEANSKPCVHRDLDRTWCPVFRPVPSVGGQRAEPRSRP